MLKYENITLESIVKYEVGNIVTDMDGEKVMMSIQNGKYYNLGEIGGVIWDLIEQPISIKTIVDNLVSKFDVEVDVCTDHVITFLTSLLKEGLIHLVDQKN